VARDGRERKRLMADFGCFTASSGMCAWSSLSEAMAILLGQPRQRGKGLKVTELAAAWNQRISSLAGTAKAAGITCRLVIQQPWLQRVLG
jgi:hypothetical protein